jgi:hypothetical protein
MLSLKNGFILVSACCLVSSLCLSLPGHAAEGATVAQSKIHPGQFRPENRVYLLEKNSVCTTLALAADKATTLAYKGPIEVEFDIPANLELKGVSSWMGSWDVTKPKKPVTIFMGRQMEDWHDKVPGLKPRSISRKGVRYTRYSFALDRKKVAEHLLGTLSGELSSASLFLAGKSGAAKTGQLFWRCKAMTLDWCSADFELLPELKAGSAPKRMTTISWCGLNPMPEVLWPQALDLMKKAGLNTYVSSGEVSPRVERAMVVAKKQGLKRYIAGQSGIYTTHWAAGPEVSKTFTALDANGKPPSFAMACPTYMEQNGELYYSTMDQFYGWAARNMTINGVVNDFEVAGTTVDYCYCPRCMTAFAKYAGLDEKNLSPRIAREEHLPKFKEFRVHQNAQIVRNWITLARAAGPGKEAIVCGVYVPAGDEKYHERFLDEEGNDIRLYDDVTDAHWPMMYYNGEGLYQALSSTRKALKKPVVPLLGANWDIGMNKFSPDRTELNVLACLMNATQGYGFYTGNFFDGKDWQTMAGLARLAANVEDVLLDGEDISSKVKVSGLAARSTCFWRAYRYKDRVLFAVINYDPTPATPDFDLSGLRLGGELVKTLYRKGQASTLQFNDVTRQLSLQLEPENAVFLEFRGLEGSKSF